MGSSVSRSHPLRQLFGALTEKSFTEHLGWPDLNVTEYVSNLLVEFAHTDQLYKIHNKQGRASDSVVDMLFESEVLLEAQSFDREREVLGHLADGQTNTTIARARYLSPRTVANHVSNILLKLQATDRTDAALRARRAGLGDPNQT